MKKPFRVSALLAAASLASVLASFASLPAAAQGAKPGDRAAGALKADACFGCHGIPGYRSSFPQVYRVPMLGGQSAQYIAAALAEYKKGDRKHPTMRAVTMSLSDTDMADLAAFYASSGEGSEVPASAAVATGAAADLIKRGNCASCHGANFNKPIDASYPKLAGQHPDYLYAALVAYQTDNNPQLGRNHPIMSAMARPFNHRELKSISDYLSTLPGELKTVEQSRWR